MKLVWHNGPMFWATEAAEQDSAHPMGLLFKQASFYSPLYTNNPQLMQSVCICSLEVFQRVLWELEEITGAGANKL